MIRHDDELRARFQELRDDDREHAPSFRALWARAEEGARTPRRSHDAALLWIAAAASVVLAAGIALRGDLGRLVAGLVPPEAREEQTLSNWRSPTAGLLRTWGSNLLAPPSIRSSILDGVTPAPGQYNGDVP